MQTAACSPAVAQAVALRSGPAGPSARPRVSCQVRRALGTSSRPSQKWALRASSYEGPRGALMKEGQQGSLPSEQPMKTASSFLIKAEQSTVEKLQEAEKGFQELFQTGKPQPTAREVSSKRKEIKELREQLMNELPTLGAGNVPQDMLASLGLGQKKLTAAEKIRATKAENGVSMDAILDLERENRELRDEANESLARLQLLEKFLQGLLEQSEASR